jgi:hypothetical protein
MAVDATSTVVLSSAAASVIGPLIDWLKSSDVVGEGAKAIATGPLGNWAHQLAERARKSGWEVVVGKLSAGKLPPNHHIANASRKSLGNALQWMANELSGHPSDALRGDLLNRIERRETLPTGGMIFSSRAEQTWVTALHALATNDAQLRALESVGLSEIDMRRLLQSAGDEASAEALHRRVGEWLKTHLADRGASPDRLSEFFGPGWPLQGTAERMTLFQAWCWFFREEIKRQPEVFNAFVANALADLLQSSHELRECPPDFASSFAQYLERPLAELLLLGRRAVEIGQRLENTVRQTSEALDRVESQVNSLPEMLVMKLAAAVEERIQLVHGERQVIVALARRLRPADDLTFAQALNEIEAHFELARDVIRRGTVSPASSSIESVLATVSDLTIAGKLEEGSRAIEDALSELAHELSSFSGRPPSGGAEL